SRERRATTQEQPLVEEPEDPEPYPQQEDLRQAADSAPDDTNPSEEGFVWNPIALEPLAVLALAPMVWSSSSAPVLAGEPVIIRSDRSHVMAWGRHQWA
ncbi:hypothetical protein U9M48_008954, partial [Paspalum notatum var. saurae]